MALPSAPLRPLCCEAACLVLLVEMPRPRKARGLSKARRLARADAAAIDGQPLPAELEDEGRRQAPHPAD
jgi:hypothetical protein